jgi:hypothetical protein
MFPTGPHFQLLGRHDLAVQMAQRARSQLRREELSNRRFGGIDLTLAAAEARLGHGVRATAALEDFNAAVPGVQTITLSRNGCTRPQTSQALANDLENI